MHGPGPWVGPATGCYKDTLGYGSTHDLHIFNAWAPRVGPGQHQLAIRPLFTPCVGDFITKSRCETPTWEKGGASRQVASRLLAFGAF